MNVGIFLVILAVAALILFGLVQARKKAREEKCPSLFHYFSYRLIMPVLVFFLGSICGCPVAYGPPRQDPSMDQQNKKVAPQKKEEEKKQEKKEEKKEEEK